eukprot:m.90988 g.90988  ORF g.90988 m.90988 type:complete len:440 (-) comp8483_c0_seq1:28-1347(-)
MRRHGAILIRQTAYLHTQSLAETAAALGLLLGWRGLTGGGGTRALAGGCALPGRPGGWPGHGRRHRGCGRRHGLQRAASLEFRSLIGLGPVIHAVILVALALEDRPPQLPHVVVVRCLQELKVPGILQVCRDLGGEALAQLVDGRGALDLADHGVALLEVVRLQALPRQAAAQEVDQHMPQRLAVVAPALLLAEMRVDAHVARRACQALVLAVRDVFARLGVDVLLGQAKVNDVDGAVTRERLAVDKEVLRLDVAEDDVLRVHVLEPADQLDRRHTDGFERELAGAHVKKILEGGPEELEDERIVLATLAVVVDLRDAKVASQQLIEPKLKVELWGAGARGLHLNGDILTCVHILAKTELSKVSSADFLANLIVFTDHVNALVLAIALGRAGAGCTRAAGCRGSLGHDEWSMIERNRPGRKNVDKTKSSADHVPTGPVL